MDLDTPPPPEASTAASQLPPSARATAAAAAMADSDPDPIVASYAVVTNPAPAAASSRKLLILQHPNKQGPLRTPYSALAEVRVKPSAGMIEVDVPLSYHDGTVYDRDKGMRWGQALSRSMAQKNGGSHGLAGGFGVGVPAPRAGRRAAKDGEESITYDWTEAVRRDQVLRTQTLGGQYAGRNAESDEECRWMIGVFKGGEFMRPRVHPRGARGDEERRKKKEKKKGFANQPPTRSQATSTSRPHSPRSSCGPSCTTSTQPPNRSASRGRARPERAAAREDREAPVGWGRREARPPRPRPSP